MAGQGFIPDNKAPITKGVLTQRYALTVSLGATRSDPLWKMD